MKAQWPQPGRKVARQIAGHANGAGGAAILWVIGVDERGRRLASPGDVEPADWWAQTAKCFAGLAPRLLDTLVVPFGGERVVALVFETDRAPYMVTTDGRCGVEREVPWRAANQTRSAHREELLRMLVEQAQVPQAEILEATVSLTKQDVDAGGRVQDGTRPPSPFTLELWMRLFVSATDPCHLPEHRQDVILRGEEAGAIGMEDLELFGPRGAAVRVSQTGIRHGDLLDSLVVTGRSGLQVNSSGQLTLRATARPEQQTAEAVMREQVLELALALGIDRSPSSLTIRVTLTRQSHLAQPRSEGQPHETLALFAR